MGSKSFSELIPPGMDDLANPLKLFAHLKSSKCDQSWLGITMHVGKTDSHLCPVAEVVAYTAVRGTSPGPLFLIYDTTPLIQAKLVSHLNVEGAHWRWWAWTALITLGSLSGLELQQQRQQ